jgi:hypothetical protein
MRFGSWDVNFCLSTLHKLYQRFLISFRLKEKLIHSNRFNFIELSKRFCFLTVIFSLPSFQMPWPIPKRSTSLWFYDRFVAFWNVLKRPITAIKSKGCKRTFNTRERLRTQWSKKMGKLRWKKWMGWMGLEW